MVPPPVAPPPAPEEEQRLAAAARRFALASGGANVALAGDAGARRYFRRTTPGRANVLVVLYPEPASAAQANWAAIGAALTAAGLRVPVLLDDAPDLGSALVEDLGDCDLAFEIEKAPPEERPELLDEAEELLTALRTLDHADARLNPPFDAGFFFRELSHTRHWALERGGASPLSEEDGQAWDRLTGELARAAADPAATGDPVPTHRDFHANNLMRAPDGRLALIDFQDLRLGPPDYDPVSLRFERAGESVPSDPAAYAEAVLLERAWKVLGTFEKMLSLGRPIYRPHRDRARRVLRTRTTPGGPWAGLLRFLPPASDGV
ncbi:MAG: phosphotransferase [Thermoanaerobaculia bacterium]